MNIRSKWAVAAGLVLLLGVSARAADAKKTRAEKGKSAAETNATVNLTTNELKPKIDFKVYKLAPTDLVEIKVYREDDLLTKARIAKDGTIAFPFLTVVNLGGKTVEEAAKRIDRPGRSRFTVLGVVMAPATGSAPLKLQYLGSWDGQ